MVKFLYIFFVVFVLSICAGRDAFASTDFISVLPDVPLAPCFVEEVDSLVTFDKPEGRYVEVSAICASLSGSEQALEAFYKNTLPQLGWRIMSGSQGAYYIKQKDRLSITYETNSRFKRIKVIVQPKDQNLG